jgi:hypothetical protein
MLDCKMLKMYKCSMQVPVVKKELSNATIYRSVVELQSEVAIADISARGC